MLGRDCKSKPQMSAGRKWFGVMQFRGSVFHTLICFLNGNIILSSLHKVNLEAHFVAVWLKFADRMAVFFLPPFHWEEMGLESLDMLRSYE